MAWYLATVGGGEVLAVWWGQEEMHTGVWRGVGGGVGGQTGVLVLP